MCKEDDINGRMFSWSLEKSKNKQTIASSSAGLPPKMILLPSLAAEDITADRIQRSRRIALQWNTLIESNFFPSDATGFEYIRLPLELEYDFAYETDGFNPTEKSIAKLAVLAGFTDPKISMNSFSFGSWKVAAKTGIKFETSDFLNSNSYILMWKTKVDRVHIALDTFCSIHFDDLYASDIAMRYRQIQHETKSTAILADKADNLLDQESNKLDSDYKSSLRRAMDLKVFHLEANARMRELQQKAETLGYRLDVQTGEITRLTNLAAQFFPAHHRTELEFTEPLGAGLGIKEARLKNYRPNDFRMQPDWTETKFTFDQAINQTVGLKDGLFDRKGANYIAATGHILSEVLEQLDPLKPGMMFNTITIPIYDLGVNTGERLTKIITAERPHKGRMPIRLPEIFIEEKFKLVLRWCGAAIGEIIESTTLAPGENRTLLIERSTVVEREARVSATSSLDITSEAKSELISELESESRRSRDASHSSNWSASTKGGVDFGIWNAGGSASGGQTWNENINEFAKRLSKLTQKASSSLTAKTRYEVASTSSYKATTSTRESTTIDLKNINQGAALTLLLHQLTNRYKKELYLSELLITVLPATETLYGSEFSLPLQFALTDIKGILNAMSVESLPFSYKNKSNALTSYYKSILEGLVTTLEEYDLSGTPTESASSILQNIKTKIKPTRLDLAAIIEETEKELKKITMPLNKNYLLGEDPIDGPCAGLLMSTYVSESTALEQYTSDLRQEELLRRRAETEEVLARAQQLRSVSNAIKPVPPGLAAIVKDPNGQRNKAEIQFIGKLEIGHWLLLVDDIARGEVDVIDAKKLNYQLSFPSKQSWLDPTNSNIGFLLHIETGSHIPFIV